MGVQPEKKYIGFTRQQFGSVRNWGCTSKKGDAPWEYSLNVFGRYFDVHTRNQKWWISG